MVSMQSCILCHNLTKHGGDFSGIRPPLNKTLFPVGRPTGLKRCDWNSFFSCFKFISFFFYYFALYILVYTTMKLGIKISRHPDWRTGNDYSPKGGPMKICE